MKKIRYHLNEIKDLTIEWHDENRILGVKIVGYILLVKFSNDPKTLYHIYTTNRPNYDYGEIYLRIREMKKGKELDRIRDLARNHYHKVPILYEDVRDE